MKLFTETQLLSYVDYWGGDLRTLTAPDYKKGRVLAAVTFYALHHPTEFPSREFWRRTIKQAVTFLRTWLHTEYADTMFRTSECKAYFQLLLDGYIRAYGELAVFKYRLQNWEVVDCQTMIDQLWTVQNMHNRQQTG